MYSYVKILFLVVIMAGLSACDNNGSASQIRIGEAMFNADYAVKDEEKAQGLMGVESLEDNYAMVFINQTPSYANFWMKNTLIPLDMLFFDAQNTLIHIEEKAEPHDLSPRGPNKLVCAVVEIKGGQARAQNIKLGDKLFLNRKHECLQSSGE